VECDSFFSLSFCLSNSITAGFNTSSCRFISSTLIIKEFKEGIARKINQLEQQEATITKLKQEVKDNKFLLEQKGIQEKAKESQVNNELNTMIVQLQGNVEVEI
jgi:hypothetical protein